MDAKRILGFGGATALALAVAGCDSWQGSREDGPDISVGGKAYPTRVTLSKERGESPIQAYATWFVFVNGNWLRCGSGYQHEIGPEACRYVVQDALRQHQSDHE